MSCPCFGRLHGSRRARGGSRAAAPGHPGGRLEITLGLPTFVGDDLGATRAVARQNLAFYTTLPFYQRLFRLCGFVEEAEKAEQGAAADALSNRLLDAVCLIGSMARCREQLAALGPQGSICRSSIRRSASKRRRRSSRRSGNEGGEADARRPIKHRERAIMDADTVYENMRALSIRLGR